MGLLIVNLNAGRECGAVTPALPHGTVAPAMSLTTRGETSLPGGCRHDD